MKETTSKRGNDYTTFNLQDPSGCGAVKVFAWGHAAMSNGALSACIGLLPAAVSTGIGSQVQRPLATVVVGGMFIGPIILLIVVPALQTLVLERADRAIGAGQPNAPQAGR